MFIFLKSNTVQRYLALFLLICVFDAQYYEVLYFLLFYVAATLIVIFHKLFH